MCCSQFKHFSCQHLQTSVSVETGQSLHRTTYLQKYAPKIPRGDRLILTQSDFWAAIQGVNHLYICEKNQIWTVFPIYFSYDFVFSMEKSWAPTWLTHPSTWIWVQVPILCPGNTTKSHKWWLHTGKPVLCLNTFFLISSPLPVSLTHSQSK